MHADHGDSLDLKVRMHAHNDIHTCMCMGDSLDLKVSPVGRGSDRHAYAC